MNQINNQAKTVLVTGGAGFIGSNLVAKLLEENDSTQSSPPNKVIVFDSIPQNKTSNLLEFNSRSDFHWIEGDVRDQKQVEEATVGGDQIYHLSSVVGVERYMESPLEVIDVNVIGTRNILDSASKNGIRVLFTSTSEVFGKNPATPWVEDADRVLGSTSTERWCYSTSKALCEHMIFALTKSQRLQCSIVRLFNVYGPKQSPHFVVSQGVHRVLHNQAPLIYDSGDQTRCFTYIDDAISGIYLAANSPNAIGQAFNIGSNAPTTVREISNLILEAARKAGQIEPENIDTARRFGERYEDIEHRVPNVDKAFDVLGWKVNIPLRDGIKSFVDWARDNPWWLARERS